MGFDRNTSKISITRSQFTLLKSSEPLFDRYSEAYIVFLAIEYSNSHPNALRFNDMHFPKVCQGSTWTMLGDEHLLYGPEMNGAAQKGHLAISDGTGKTMEAAGTNLGVRDGNVSGRVWDSSGTRRWVFWNAITATGMVGPATARSPGIDWPTEA